MGTVDITSVTAGYGSAEILTNLSLKINAGERIVISGPSGCGKTTLLRLIAGFTAPSKGTVMLNSQIVSQDGCIIVPPEQRNTAMVFQNLALWPHLTVAGNLEFGLKARGIQKKIRQAKILQTLEMIDLKDSRNKKPGELSGGEQQRVALGRALILEPELLLMDEPLSNLDRALSGRLQNEITALQERLKFTLVYVTHNKDEVSRIASRVIVMKQGGIIAGQL
jgi:ABC-type Fe3+/spermidine/putrescine transport system ATPase subunit